MVRMVEMREKAFRRDRALRRINATTMRPVMIADQA